MWDWSLRVRCLVATSIFSKMPPLYSRKSLLIWTLFRRFNKKRPAAPLALQMLLFHSRSQCLITGPSTNTSREMTPLSSSRCHPSTSCLSRTSLRAIVIRPWRGASTVVLPLLIIPVPRRLSWRQYLTEVKISNIQTHQSSRWQLEQIK